MLIVLSVIHVLICLAIIISMYFHRGTDSLFSGGGGGGGVAGMANSTMPKKIMTPLDKVIGVFVALFFISTLLLNYVAYKEGKIDFMMDRLEKSDKVQPKAEESPDKNQEKQKDLPSLPVAQ